mmetsp:Transcript_33794/g.52150  ORF Transcript_33794/g.52150 Transcript_33794/m.52150 type:complete len:114 (-) Transcript_33794:86-427(-)
MASLFTQQLQIMDQRKPLIFQPSGLTSRTGTLHKEKIEEKKKKDRVKSAYNMSTSRGQISGGGTSSRAFHPTAAFTDRGIALTQDEMFQLASLASLKQYLSRENGNVQSHEQL